MSLIDFVWINDYGIGLAILWLMMLIAVVILFICGGFLMLMELNGYFSFKRRLDIHIKEIEKGNYDDKPPKCQHIWS